MSIWCKILEHHLTLIDAEGGIMARVLRTVTIAQIILDEEIAKKWGYQLEN